MQLSRPITGIVCEPQSHKHGSAPVPVVHAVGWLSSS